MARLGSLFSLHWPVFLQPQALLDFPKRLRFDKVPPYHQDLRYTVRPARAAARQAPQDIYRVSLEQVIFNSHLRVG